MQLLLSDAQLPGHDHPLLGVATSRQLEQRLQASLPDHALIERAGLALAKLALALAPQGRMIWLLCGPGNNGGDALIAARHLQEAGRRVQVRHIGASASAPPDARHALARALAAGVPIQPGPAEIPADCELVVDGLLGLGADRPAAGALAEAIQHINARPAGVRALAVDLPSGLHAGTGACLGDAVRAGQVLGQMAPVDLDDRGRAASAAQRQALAALAEARARQAYAASQLRRYEQLVRDKYVSAESVSARRQEAQVASAAVSAAEQAVGQARAEGAAVASQRMNLDLVSPVDGIVTLRSIDPGTTVVAGQAVVEVVDPRELWVNARFDQGSAGGLVPGLPARIVLRSRQGQVLEGKVLRVEPKADVVTEETLAKLVFAHAPQPLPPLGELAEASVLLPRLATAPVVPNAALHRVDGEVGVWKLVDGELAFAPVQAGASDLDGRVQVLRGLAAGDRVVVYSEKPLTARSRIKIVDALAGARR